MNNQFYKDLEQGKIGERIVLDALSSYTHTCLIEDISDLKEYRYKGDIRLTDKNGNQLFIEVKTDSRIADTGNVLCEDEVYFKDGDYYGHANMNCKCDIYAVVSQEEQKIYFIDFSILKQHYRQGEFKQINHSAQITYAYLLPLGVLRKLGGLLGVVKY